MASLQSLTGGLQNIQAQINPAKPINTQVYGPANPATGKIGGMSAPQVAQNTASQINNSGGGNTNTSQAPQIPQPSAPNIDFDSLIKPALDALDQAIAPLQNANAADIQGINDAATQQRTDTNQNIAGQTSTINQAQQQQTTNENSATDQARRQYAEVQQGLQARYGGTTGTGEFATEYAGGNAIRSIADIHTAARQAQQGLTDKLLQVQEVGRTALQNIDTNAQDLITKAKSNLDLQLSDIRQQKGNLLMNKAQMAAQAMQAYQSAVDQVNQQNAQFKQQLYVQQQAAQQALQAKLQSAQAITSAATPQELLSIVQGIQNQVGPNSGIDTTVNQKLTGGGTIQLSSGNKTNASTNPIDDAIAAEIKAQQNQTGQLK